VDLRVLGFKDHEIYCMQELMSSGEKITPMNLSKLGFNVHEVGRLKQLHGLMSGRVEIEDSDDFAKQLKKLSVGHKTSIRELPPTRVTRVPRKAVIHSIEDSTFKMYNSSNYGKVNKFYDVVTVGGNRIHIETARKPVLKYKQSKKVDGVIEITELLEDGRVRIAVNREYASLCNRYVIVAGVREPDVHHGCAKMVIWDGSKIYVYVKSIGRREKLDYMLSSVRVYDHGIFKEDIEAKLKLSVETVGYRLGAKHVEYLEYTEEYEIRIPEGDREEDSELQILD